MQCFGPDRFCAAGVAVREALQAGQQVALFCPGKPGRVPADALRAALQRGMQLPPHLIPHDPVIGAVLHGEASRLVVERLREAAEGRPGSLPSLVAGCGCGSCDPQ